MVDYDPQANLSVYAGLDNLANQKTVINAMEYRNQEIELSDGNVMSIPDNVVLIFTENTLDPSNGLDLAIRRRMTC